MFKPVEQEAKRLRHYDADSVLNVISSVSTSRRKDQDKFRNILEKENLNYLSALRDFQLGFVVKLVLHFYDKPRLSRRKFDLKALLAACASHTKHQNPSSYPLNSREDIDRFFFRAAYQQFPDFYGDPEIFARTRLLFRECVKTVDSKVTFNIDDAFKGATGLTLDQVWDITFGLYGLIMEKNGGIQQGPIKPGDLLTNITDDELQRYVDMISINAQQFREVMKQPEYQLDYYETFNPNPLVSWPMIRLANERWVVPIPPYLFRRGTEQVFYDVIKYADREFTGFLGYVFEEYADYILTTLGDNYQIHSAVNYSRNGKSCDTCDRIIIKDGDAVLIECKTKRLKLATKFTADENRLRNDLTDLGKGDDKSSVVHAIRQLYRTEKDIRSKCSGLEDLHNKITGRFFPVVLVLDPYYFANGPYVKRIITQELQQGDNPIQSYDWQIIHTGGFEQLCALSRNAGFIDLMATKFSTQELREQEMETFLHNYCNNEMIDTKALRHPLIDIELDKFKNEIDSRYRP